MIRPSRFASADGVRVADAVVVCGVGGLAGLVVVLHRRVLVSSDGDGMG
jgi:hypothetical protein